MRSLFAAVVLMACNPTATPGSPIASASTPPSIRVGSKIVAGSMLGDMVTMCQQGNHSTVSAINGAWVRLQPPASWHSQLQPQEEYWLNLDRAGSYVVCQ